MRQAFLVGLIALFAGCATAPRSAVEQAHVWRNPNGIEVISDGATCHKVIQFNAQSNANEWIDIPCTTVALTHDPADEEFWTFMAHIEQKVQVTAFYGLVPVGPAIPAGRIRVSFRVVGSEKVCEAARESIARGRPVNDLESGRPGTPTEPCKGPGFFKRAAGQSALKGGQEPIAPKSEAVAPARSELGSPQIGRTCNNHIPSSCAP
jgi:hypothetical protein